MCISVSPELSALPTAVPKTYSRKELKDENMPFFNELKHSMKTFLLQSDNLWVKINKKYSIADIKYNETKEFPSNSKTFQYMYIPFSLLFCYKFF